MRETLAPPLTEQAHDADRVWNLFLVLGLGIGALVVVLILYVVVRFRRRGSALPAQVREHIPLELFYTAVPLLIVAALFAVTFVSVRAIDDTDEDADLVVAVTGFQWQWQFDYPDHGVTVLGTRDTIPELVLPAGATVRFELTSADVIHSFWIPGFRFKRDLFPNQTTTFSVDVGDRTGSWAESGVCAEFCGLDHAFMRFSVGVVGPGEFDEWIEANGGQP
jgi:cytochrome c oxidase subunit 2